MKLRINVLLVAIAISGYATDAFALRLYLEAWRDKYPDSTSDAIGTEGCQLCHERASGGNPWNEYGWRIRQVFSQNGSDIIEAIELAENRNLDNDPAGRPSIDEINYNFQPGWTAGANNTVYFANGSTIANQLPPDLSSFPQTALDWPTSSISNPIPGDIAVGAVSVSTKEVAGRFNAPLKAVKAPGINGSLFVVEQAGRIIRVNLASGEKTLFHDVSADLVELSSRYDERGLLGLAFHPDFASNGLFYTYQSEPIDSSSSDFPLSSGGANHRSVVAEYRASNPSCNSRVSNVGNMLVIDQPQSNHNGGDLVFGPDGYLYVSLGDGGSADDEGSGHGELGNGRDPANPLGAILRIDPLGNNSANGKYGIPASNPFVGQAELDEIYAFGFRNPYRISFDAQTGELYAADVGQNQIEEVNLVESGGNFGWNRKEGSFYLYNPKNIGGSNIGGFISDIAPPAQPANLIDPIAQYDHDGGARISITGGYVYRGNQIAGLQGRYVFADYLRQLFYLDDGNTVSRFNAGSQTDDFVTGFGQDADNELYILTSPSTSPDNEAGKLLKLTSLGDDSPAPSSDGESSQCPAEETVCLPIKAENGNVTVICL